jgi:predicted nuclease with TOPRIM domain
VESKTLMDKEVIETIKNMSLEIKELKDTCKEQTELLKELVNLFTKYDQDLLLEEPEVLNG